MYSSLLINRLDLEIKLCKLCESSPGYCVNFKICTGDDLVEGSDKRASENIVPELAEPILGKGCASYLDNWCLSPILYLELCDRRTNAFGTLKSNRKNGTRCSKENVEGRGSREIKLWLISCKLEGSQRCLHAVIKTLVCGNCGHRKKK
jgi:hypothetical protein